MTTSAELFEQKEEYALERDLCAEMYNIWMTKLHRFQDDPEKYKLYLHLIATMEPYTNMLKEEIRAINREICKLEGVENIEDTKYVHECKDKYGYEKPRI